MQLTSSHCSKEQTSFFRAETRRQWIRKATLASTAASLLPWGVANAEKQGTEAFKLDLTVWKLGIPGNQEDAIRWARQFEFESVGAHTDEVIRWSAAQRDHYAETLQGAGLQWGVASLPVNFRRSSNAFRESIQGLPDAAKALSMAGIKKVITHIMPCHDSLTYLQNFRMHTDRLKEVVHILADHDLRFGMEYVGTETLRNRRKFPFIHTLREGLELASAIDPTRVGLVMDCWHWHNAGDTLEDLARLEPHHVVSIELNDAPAGIQRPLLQDHRRELPVATGMIDTKGFLNGLARLGIKEIPLMAEPFNQAFRDMPREPGIATIADSLKKARNLVH
ncbi:MAG: TIM barrel protein [Verrucomicrobiota bacterium]|nr:TIM barrel protein [Verrucomicrobiota bacterium]